MNTLYAIATPGRKLARSAGAMMARALGLPPTFAAALQARFDAQEKVRAQVAASLAEKPRNGGSRHG